MRALPLGALAASALLVSIAPPLDAQTQVASVEVVPANASAIAGEAVQFEVKATGPDGSPVTDAEVHWIATPYDIAGADADGRVTTFRAGRVYVIALVGGKPGVATLDIGERPVARLEVLAPGGDTLIVGGTILLDVRGFTEVGDPVPVHDVAWRSSDRGVVRAYANGMVTGVSEGSTAITAQMGDLTGHRVITVTQNPVESVVLRTRFRSLRTGDVIHLAPDLRDERNRPVGNMPVRWSASGPGAAVYPDGRFVAEVPGIYLVNARVGELAGTTALRVVPRQDPRRVEKVAHVPLPGDVQAAEIWPIGDVAYVSSIAGKVYTFDISDPANPVLVDSLVVDARLVNDVSTTADGKIGVLTREGASDRENGLVFFDASDPLHPKPLSEFTETVTGGVHGAFVHGRHVFATDDATGSLRIIDIEDPRNPKQVGRWEIPRDATAYRVDWLTLSPQRYLHDVWVENGLAYLAYWRDGLVILDVGNGIKGGSVTEPRLVSQFKYNHAELYPPGYIAGTHAVFPYGDYVFVADESYSGTIDLFSRKRFATRGLVHVIDVRDIERPQKVAEYDPVEFGAHNLWAADGLLYVAAYNGGIRVLDISGELRGDLREQGRVVGDLYTGSLDGYRPNMALAWSAIPHRGHVFASDINTGLWVARVSTPPVP